MSTNNRGETLRETCPLCGTEDVMLSSHLPKCDERTPPEGFDDE